MFKNLSLKAKIFNGFLTVCLGLIIVAASSYYGLKQVVKTYDQLAEISVPNLGHVSGLRARGRQIHVDLVKLALYQDQVEEVEKTRKSLSAAIKRYEEITQEYLETEFYPGEKEIFDVVENDYQLVKKTAHDFLTLFDSDDPNKTFKMKDLLLIYEEQVLNHQSALLKLDDFHVELGTKWSNESRTLSERIEGTLLAVALVTFLGALACAHYLSKRINNVLADVANRLAESSDVVSQNSTLLNEASQNLSSGTTEQAEALHETVSSTNEIAAMTEKASENSRESLSRAQLSKEASSQGQKSLKDMMEAISEISHSNSLISEQVKRGNQEIQQIADLILKIGEKTKLIDDIVFQTKLLSFNVSVEAARAGEHGKGFAVVAEEMANLADMSGNASKEITSMLDETTKKALSVIESNQRNIDQLLQSGEEKVKLGQSVADRCQHGLEQIVHYVEEMYTMINETSQSTYEQAKGIAEINKAMGQIDAVTSQNSHSANQCSEAAAALQVEVNNTRQIVEDLLKVIHGVVQSNAVAATDQAEPEAEVSDSSLSA